MSPKVLLLDLVGHSASDVAFDAFVLIVYLVETNLKTSYDISAHQISARKSLVFVKRELGLEQLFDPQLKDVE
jgi:hypothetical protein